MFTADGQLIASAGSDGTVRLWLSTGEQVDQFDDHTGFLSQEALGGSFGMPGVSLSPDSRYIAIADGEGATAIWRIQNLGELISEACAWLNPYLASHPTEPRLCSH